MRAVLCALNSKYIHSALAPWYLAAAVKAYAGDAVTVSVVEGTINQSDDAVLERLLAQPADVIGFCCYIWNIAMVRRLLPRVRQAVPEAVLVLGGPEVSFCAQQVMTQLPEVDYVQAGEGERPFAQLLMCLAAGEDIGDVPGLCRRTAQGIVCAPPYSTAEEPPSPYTPAYFEALQGRIAYLETSRGCPFSCAFCLSGRQDKVRFFDLERAKADMVRLANSGTQTVKLVDRTFNCNAERAYALWEFLIAQAGKTIPAGVCFHFEIAADLLDERTLALLATAPAGLIQLEAGLQSFHEPTLAAVNRKTNLDRLCANLRALLKAGNIHVHIDLIAGLPEEDLACFGRSFDRAYALQPHMLQLGFLKLLHGSRLRQDADAYGYVFSQEPPYAFIRGNWMNEREAATLHEAEDALERLYNSGRFRDTLAYVLAATGLRPFELFCTVGAFMAQRGVERISLEDYTALVQTCLQSLPGVDAAVLRDVMVCDSLSSHSNGRLPACLYREDARLKRLARQVKANSVYPQKGVKRGVAILYAGGERAVAAEYVSPDPVTGRYALKECSLDGL